jgi:shikimate kinase
MIATFKEFLSESINDKGIFKAIFVVGLPGAGKSYTVKQLNGTISPKIINTDKASEFLASKWQKEIKSDTWKEFEDTTKRMTKEMLTQYLNSMLPLFIDGTSNDVSNILNRMGILESLGYDIGVVFVHTSLETAIKRAQERAKSIGRHVNEDFIREVNSRNDENVKYLKTKVGFFKQVENDSDSLGDAQMLAAFKETQSFFSKPIDNPIGNRTIEKMKAEKYKYLTPELMSMDVLSKKVEGWYRN